MLWKLSLNKAIIRFAYCTVYLHSITIYSTYHGLNKIAYMDIRLIVFLLVGITLLNLVAFLSVFHILSYVIPWVALLFCFCCWWCCVGRSFFSTLAVTWSDVDGSRHFTECSNFNVLNSCPSIYNFYFLLFSNIFYKLDVEIL